MKVKRKKNKKKSKVLKPKKREKRTGKSRIIRTKKQRKTTEEDGENKGKINRRKGR